MVTRRPSRISLTGLISTVWQNWSLIRQFAVRDLQSRYKGMFLGLLWTLLVPLIMLFVYTFVFSIIFEARWGNIGHENKAMFAVVLFANLTLYNLLNETVSSSCGLILFNANLVKKVVFPLEILPISRVIAVLLQSLLSFAVLLAAIFFVHHLSWTILFLPLVLGPVLLLALGGSYLAASLTVFVRDLGQLVGVFLTLLLFLSPIFYPVEAIPEEFRTLVYLNPFAFLLEQFRQIMVFGNPPDALQLLVLWLGSGIFAFLGFAFFVKSKSSFADVL